MKRTFLCAALAVLLFSCDKEKDDEANTTPVFEYTDLQDRSVTYANPALLDLDKDGTADFSITTILIQSNSTGYLQFRAGSAGTARLLLNEDEYTVVLDSNVVITKGNQDAFVWSPVGTAILSALDLDKEPTDNNSWSGPWKNAQEKYLPVQLVKQNKVYNGWIRMSHKSNSSEFLLHEAAISKTPNISIKAGQK